MADSKRETIFKKIEVILNNIQGMGAVHRGKGNLLSENRYPVAYIYPGVDEVENTVGELSTRNMEVFVECWQMSQVDSHLEAEAFLPKVQKALAADYSLTGAVIKLYETAVSSRLLSEDQSESGFVIQFDCQYRVVRTDPYA